MRAAAALLVVLGTAGSAAGDPAAISKLVQRYEAESDPIARRALVAQLGKARAVAALGGVLAKDPDEQVRLAAIAGLLKVDDAASTRLLTQALGPSDPWVSEAIVVGLSAQHRPAAVTRLRLRLSESDAEVRAAALRVVAHHDRAACAPILESLLADPSWRVRELAGPLLAGFEPTRALATLAPLLRDTSARVRLAAVRALADVPGPKATKLLCRVAKLASPWQVQRVAIDGLVRRGAAPHRRVLFRFAKTKANDWRLRAAAARGLGTIKEPAAVEHLLELLKRTEGRLQSEVRRALQRLTGQPIANPKDWRAFWAKAKDDFSFPTKVPDVAKAAKTPPRLVTRARFYGLPIESLRPCFLIDCSGSMAEPATDPRRGTKARKGAPWTKWQVAKRELKEALETLPRQAKFGVFLFQDRTVAIQERPIAARPAAIKRVLAQLERVSPTGATNLHNALATVLHGARPRDPFAASEVDYDAVYVLSDGLPTAGRVIEPDAIRTRVRAYNQFAEVVIHTVGIGAQNRSFLEALATEHKGRFVLRR